MASAIVDSRCIMLAPAVVAEIERLLAAGQLSQRAIARHLGVSRGIIQLIACGKRRKHPPVPVPGASPPPSGPWGRCPHCGGRVQFPCLVCRLRASRDRTVSVCGCP